MLARIGAQFEGLAGGLKLRNHHLSVEGERMLIALHADENRRSYSGDLVARDRLVVCGVVTRDARPGTLPGITVPGD
jgi:hypothetical protein